MPRSALMHVMTSAALKAGKAILRDFGELDRLQVSRKGTADFATNADRRAERIIHQDLAKARPTFSFVMEESGEMTGSDPTQRFVVDPIDGTNNFIHAVSYFCISIAYEKQLTTGSFETQAAVIYDPIQNELFTAELHQGALLNDRRLIVSGRSEPERCMIASFVPPADSATLAARLHHAVSQAPFVMRATGATALDLAYIAAGRYDGGCYASYHHWDVAAGLLLVREAGGKSSERREGEATYLLAGNPAIHDILAANPLPR